MFKPGNAYSKVDMYRILNVPSHKQKGSWNTGYVQYDGEYFIFANIGIAGRTGHNYANELNGSILTWFAKTGTNIHQASIKELTNEKTKVHIFTRTNDRDPFTYQGLGKALTVRPRTPVEIIWHIEKKEIINAEKAWAMLTANAFKFVQTRENFLSPIAGDQFKILNATKNSITIECVNDDFKTVDLTYADFQAAIENFNANHGQLARNNVNDNIALETTIVSLSPMMDWDDSFENIVYIDPTTDAPFSEARNDETIANILLRRRIRQGQNKLKNNLLGLYDSQCCVSRCEIRELLHACHIVPHSETGDNSSTNALLMRADVHDLFDGNLIGIHPNSLEIKVHGRILHTEYAKFNNQELLPRSDGKKPNEHSLRYRWQLFNKR